MGYYGPNMLTAAGWAEYGHSTARQGRQHQSDRGAAGAAHGAAVPAMRSSGEDVPLMQGRVSLGVSRHVNMLSGDEVYE